MTEYEDKHGGGADGEAIPGASAGSAESVAAELVVHGLLASMQPGGKAARAARLDRTLRALRSEGTAVREERQERQDRRARTRRMPRFGFRRAVRWTMPIAAVFAIALLAVFFTPAQQNAWATVQGSIDALREGGARRFEIRMLTWDETNPFNNPVAVVDTRPLGGPLGVGVSRGAEAAAKDADSNVKPAPASLLVVAHRPPWAEKMLYVGRDEKGAWGVEADGTIERGNPSWPPWAVDGDSRVVDSLDRLLEQLSKNYTVQKLEGAVPEGGSFLCDRVLATRTPGARRGPFPQYVEIWVDPVTKLTERVEFRWDRYTRSAEGRPKHEGAPGSSAVGAPSEGAKSGAAATAGGEKPAAGAPAPVTSQSGPSDRPEGSDRSPGGGRPEEAGVPRHRGGSPWPRSDGEKLGAGGGRDGPPPNPSASGSSSGSRDGKDGRGRGRRSIKAIVFQRVPTPDLPDDWFTPEGHGGTIEKAAKKLDGVKEPAAKESAEPAAK